MSEGAQTVVFIIFIIFCFLFGFVDGVLDHILEEPEPEDDFDECEILE